MKSSKEAPHARRCSFFFFFFELFHNLPLESLLKLSVIVNEKFENYFEIETFHRWKKYLVEISSTTSTCSEIRRSKRGTTIDLTAKKLTLRLARGGVHVCANSWHPGPRRRHYSTREFLTSHDRRPATARITCTFDRCLFIKQTIAPSLWCSSTDGHALPAIFSRHEASPESWAY